MTSGDTYETLFKREWYHPDHYPTDAWPSPLGLSLGILAVIVGQLIVLAYHWLHVRLQAFGPIAPVQKSGPEPHDFFPSMLEHLSQPEGFVLLGGYLCGTWMFRLMPPSYYSFAGGVDWAAVATQLLLQDGLQMLMHLGEHKVDALLGTNMWFYRKSHKPHHRFTNPKLFDAFNGSLSDTFFMILVPLLSTAHLCRTVNVWTYMAFGTLYANGLCLIHSEAAHPWDGAFAACGVGTAADHHVHHTLFTWNYGHLFTYFDRLAGTYKPPALVHKLSAHPNSAAAESKTE